MKYHYVWLIWSSAFLLPWIVLYLWNRRWRTVMWRVSLVTALLGLSEPVLVPRYWNPPSLFDLAQRTGFNPCDALERPKVQPSPARGYTALDVQKILAVIPDTVAGRRDRAIVLTLVMTGRRRSEVINLKAKDISVEGVRSFYSYRGKGGKLGRRELPRPAFAALLVTLGDVGKCIATMAPDESLWQAGAGERGVTSATFYNRLRKYMVAAGLPPTGVHILRHTAAKLRRDAGESIEAVSQFLDHSSLAVTTVYLRRLEGQTDESWGRVAEDFEPQEAAAKV